MSVFESADFSSPRTRRYEDPQDLGLEVLLFPEGARAGDDALEQEASERLVAQSALDGGSQCHRIMCRHEARIVLPQIVDQRLMPRRHDRAVVAKSTEEHVLAACLATGTQW